MFATIFFQFDRIQKDANVEWKKECEEMLTKQKKEFEENEKKYQEEMKKLKEDAEKERRDTEERIKRMADERSECDRSEFEHGYNLRRRIDVKINILILGTPRIS
jgi:hypothetical protein